ncbi:MAG: DUF3829 domain-containing protein [Deltaproteobacteria bacterium]|nr:DUF3829 domain-containing protein [Deltaproteobacteria bacterium]
MTLRSLSCVLLSIALFSSCKAVREAAEQVAGQVAKQAAGGDEEGEDMLGLYAKGYNAIIGVVPEAVRSYDSAVPMGGEPGPEMRKPLLLAGVLADMKLKEAAESFERARAAAPEKFKHMIPMADELMAASKEIMTLYSEAQKYYDAENFKDDGYENGKKIHSKIIPAVGRYEKAVRVLEAALDAEEDKIITEEMKEHESAKSYSYYIRSVHVEAKKAVKVVDDPKSDAAAVAAAAEAFARTCEEMKGFVDRQAEPNVTFRAFVDAADRYLASLKRLRRALEAEPREDEAIHRELDLVISSYNSFISLRNSLAELEQNGLLR